jgi:hypothetical protein
MKTSFFTAIAAALTIASVSSLANIANAATFGEFIVQGQYDEQVAPDRIAVSVNGDRSAEAVSELGGAMWKDNDQAFVKDPETGHRISDDFNDAFQLTDPETGVSVKVETRFWSANFGKMSGTRFLNFSLPDLAASACHLDSTSDTEDMQRAALTCQSKDGPIVRYEIVVDGGGTPSPTTVHEVLRMNVLR